MKRLQVCLGCPARGPLGRFIIIEGRSQKGWKGLFENKTAMQENSHIK